MPRKAPKDKKTKQNKKQPQCIFSLWSYYFISHFLFLPAVLKLFTETETKPESRQETDLSDREKAFRTTCLLNSLWIKLSISSQELRGKGAGGKGGCWFEANDMRHSFSLCFSSFHATLTSSVSKTLPFLMFCKNNINIHHPLLHVYWSNYPINQSKGSGSMHKIM